MRPELENPPKTSPQSRRYLFPIVRNTKVPPKGFTDPFGKASDDPEQIAIWEKQFPGCNWALACGRSNLIVMDVDIKKGAKGLESLENWEAEFGKLPATRKVRSPSGGFHLYFSGCRASDPGWKPGIDIKSDGGYVLLPGSKTKAGIYEWENDLPVANAPEVLLSQLDAPKEKTPRNEVPACDELDDPQAISRAVTFLLKEASIDDTGYQVACQVRDFGVSEDMCFLLMWEHYADRCEEPWEPEVLRQKVANAYQYAQNQCGVLAPQETLKMLPDVQGETKGPATPKGISCTELVQMEIPEIVWMVDKLIVAGLTIIAGKPKVGKSWFALQLILTTGAGTPFLGRQTEQCQVVYLALEDGPRRLQSRIKQLLAGSSVPDGILFFNDWLRLDKGGFDALERLFIENPKVRLLVVDVWQKIRPIAKPKGATSYEVDYAEASKLKRLADRYQVALILITHLRKPGKSAGADIFDEVSGSTGITGCADSTLILTRFRNVADAELHITGRDVEEEKLALARDANTCRWVCLGSAEGIQKTPERQMILTAVEKLGAARPTQIAEAAGLDLQYCKNTLPKLLREGALEKVKHGLYQVPAERRTWTPEAMPDLDDFL